MLEVAVILPTVNRDSLQQAIDSVWSQTYPGWHLYIIDDTQNQEGHVWDHPSSRTTMLCCDGPHNDSGAYARNFGIKHSTEDWIAYIDCDDYWLPHHLETHARMIKENPGVNMTRTAGQTFMMKHKSPRSSEKIRKLGPVNSTDILTITMSHTRDLFNKTNGWQHGTAHDRDLWNAMLNAGGKPIQTEAITALFKR